MLSAHPSTEKSTEKCMFKQKLTLDLSLVLTGVEQPLLLLLGGVGKLLLLLLLLPDSCNSFCCACREFSI
jgi:hypothetical protein